MNNRNHIHYLILLFLFATLSAGGLCGQELNVNVIPPSYIGILDGEIIATVIDDDDEGPYIFEWYEMILGQEIELEPSEETYGSSTISGLNEGEYCVRVTSQLGCSAYDCFLMAPCQNTCLQADFTYTVDYDQCTVIFDDISSGAVDNYEWTFGDGASSSATNPNHGYAEAGCFTVELTVYDEGEQSSSKTEEVCVSYCGDDFSSGPECNVNGPNIAGAGQSISLYAAPVGIGPFSYEWSVPNSQINILSATDDATLSFIINEGLTNGTSLEFFVDVIDANGNYSTCTHTITITGNIPEVEIGVFGSMQPNTYLLFSTFVDVFNLTGLEEYLFTLKGINGNVIWTSPWLNGDYDLDICTGDNGQVSEPEGDDFCLSDGVYTVCVDVKDAIGIYSDCKEFVIGDPPPPSPKIIIFNEDAPDSDGPFDLSNSTAPIPIAFDVNSNPFNNTANCPGEFYIELFATRLGEENPQTFLIGGGGWETLGGCQVEGLFISANNVIMSVSPSNLGCIPGTYAITATFTGTNESDDVNDCCSFAESSQNYDVTEPVLINFLYEPPLVESIEVEFESWSCEYRLKAEISGGCRASNGTSCISQFYDQYEWKVYDVITGQPIDEFCDDPTGSPFLFTNDQQCAQINTDHCFFKSISAGQERAIRCELMVQDYEGFTGQGVQTIILGSDAFPLPLQANLSSDQDIIRCPNTISTLFNGVPAYGGSGNYEISLINAPPAVYIDDEGEVIIDLVNHSINGSVNFSIEISDQDYSACTPLNIPLTLTSQTLQAYAHDDMNDYMWICVDQSLKRLGRSDDQGGVAIGGSGAYSYLWEPSIGLDNPFSSHPSVSLGMDEFPVTYTLTVIDEFGCTATDEVTAKISQTYPSADAGLDLSLCFGEELNPIGGNPVASDFSTNTLIADWSINHPGFDLSVDPSTNKLIGASTTDGNKDISTIPGTYTFDVTAYHPHNGCYSTDEMTLIVREEWNYLGYESELRKVVEGEAVGLWDNENNIVTSGYTNPVNYNWTPASGPAPSNLQFNQDIPKYGLFVPTVDHPSLTLNLTDANGCKKTFHSNRYITVDGEPSIDINPSNRVICMEETICFDIIFDIKYTGTSSIILPPEIDLIFFVDTYDMGEYVEFQEYLTVVLDEEGGVYKGTGCFTPLLFFVNGEFRAGCRTPFNSFWGNVVNTVDFEISPPIEPELDPNNTYNGPVLCGSINNPVVGGEFLTIGLPVNNCTSAYASSVPINEITAGTQIRFAPNLSFHTTDEGQFHAFINPCIDDPEFVEPQIFSETISEEAQLPEKQIETQDNAPTSPDAAVASSNLSTLTVYPNPFNDRITVEYNITGTESRLVNLLLLDVTGRVVHTFFEEQTHQPGSFKLAYDGSNLAPGIYFYHLSLDRGERQVTYAVKAR